MQKKTKGENLVDTCFTESSDQICGRHIIMSVKKKTRYNNLIK